MFLVVWQLSFHYWSQKKPNELGFYGSRFRKLGHKKKHSQLSNVSTMKSLRVSAKISNQKYISQNKDFDWGVRHER